MGVQNNATIEGMVSIIIPVYNADEFLQKSVESAIHQTYVHIEILLINDGSTDGSGKLCDEYALNDRRIKAVHKKNSGPSDARNVGIEHSCGEFIFFMDADDNIEPDAVESLIVSQLKIGADIVVGDYRKIGRTISSSGNEAFFKESILIIFVFQHF